MTRTKKILLVSAVALIIVIMGRKKITLYIWDKVSQNRIDKLHPAIRQNVIDFINDIQNELGIKLRLTDGIRTFDEQDELYTRGRTKPGAIVTYARGGESYHNYGLAFDVVEIKDGFANYNVDYSQFKPIANRYNLEWGGNWISPKTDKPHYQNTFGNSIAELQDKFNGGEVDANNYVIV